MPDATPKGRPSMMPAADRRIGMLPPHRPQSRALHHRLIRGGVRVYLWGRRSAEGGVHKALGGAPEAIGAKRAESPWDHQQDIIKVFEQTTDAILKPDWQFRSRDIEKPAKVHGMIYKLGWAVVSATHGLDAVTDVVEAGRRLARGEPRQALVLGAMAPVDYAKRLITPFIDAHAIGGTVDRHGVLTKLQTLTGLAENLNPAQLHPVAQEGQPQPAPLSAEQLQTRTDRRDWTAYLYGQFLTLRPDKAAVLAQAVPSRIQFIEQNIQWVVGQLQRREARGDNEHLWGKRKRQYKSLERQLVLYDIYLLEAKLLQEIAQGSTPLLQSAAQGRR